ncbi:Nucleolar protein 9 [Nymphon striatum]|nr:Nucleolar protein 9 [Nymphon striatum]
MKVHIQDEEFRYYEDLYHRIQEPFDDDEDKENFLENAFCEMKTREMDYSCNKTLSRFIEECLRMSFGLDNLKFHIQFMDAFGENIRLVCKDQYASHVVQTLIHCIPKIFDDEKTKDADTLTPQVESWIIKLSKFAINNVAEFITDPYASHILRTLLQLWSGHVEQKLTKKNSNHPTFSMFIPKPHLLPDIFAELLKSFEDQFYVLSRQLKVWCCDELCSPVLQTLLFCIHHRNPERTDKFVKYILKATAPDDSKTKETLLLTDEKGSHLMEQIFTVISPKLRKRCYKKYLRSKFSDICSHPNSNFVVQRFLKSIEDTDLFVKVYGELSSELGNIIYSRKTGLLVAIAESCVRLSSCQGTFVTEIEDMSLAESKNIITDFQEFTQTIQLL